MATWGDILKEIQDGIKAENKSILDDIRRKYLLKLHRYTKRSTILYASGWTSLKPGVNPNLYSICDEDIHGFMSVIHKLDGPNLDLILHSPGGSAETTEAIVIYLRSKYKHIRVIVPQVAMSAATMLACAADEIIMGDHSFLGPIDPQLIIPTETGVRGVAAQDILDQFIQAAKESKNPNKYRIWAPILPQYGPDLIILCQTAQKLSEHLATEWLTKYMFKSSKNPKKKGREIAKWLGKRRVHKTHARHLGKSTLKKKGLNIVDLESDPKLQEYVLSIFHATMHTLGMTSAVKIIENHKGKAYVKHGGAIVGPGPPP